MFPFDEKEYEEALSVMDPDLPMLASQASIELDNLLLGGKGSMLATEKLRRFLEISFAADAYVDAATSVVIGRAICQVQGQRPPRTIKELIAQTLEIAGQLGEPTNKSSNLKKMRDFCAALSLASASYIRQLTNSRPTNPLRRS